MKNKDRRTRVAPVFIGVLLFITLVLVLISFELNTNRSRIISQYNDQTTRSLNAIMLLIKTRQNNGDSLDDIVAGIPEYFSASGNCFLVFESDGRILFAKTIAATERLSNNGSSSYYWESLTSQDIQVSSEEWDYQGASYKLSIVTETDSIYDQADVVQHDYYILFAIIVMSIVLFSMLVTYVGILDKTSRNLARTQNELTTKTAEFENYFEDENNSTKKTGMVQNDSQFEQKYLELNRFYDVSVLRALLSKSNVDDLKPVRILFIKFLMSERYYSASEISEFAMGISASLKQREVLFELRKGLFAVVFYKSNDAEIELRKKALFTKLEELNSKKNSFRGFDGNVFELGLNEESVIEDFEKVYKEEIKQYEI